MYTTFHGVSTRRWPVVIISVTAESDMLRVTTQGPLYNVESPQLQTSTLRVTC